MRLLMKIKQILISIVASSTIFGGILAVTPTATITNQVSAAVTKAKVQPNAQPKSVMLPANWWGPSESVPYPNVAQHPKMWIHVSLAKQRVYLMDGGKTLYTMYASTGLPKRGWGATPKGTFFIQRERGKSFSEGSGRGRISAYNFVSFKDHGVYLFHSVPVDYRGHVLPFPAGAQGKYPSSHGCIHLSLADSKWFFQNIRYNTMVIIN